MRLFWQMDEAILDHRRLRMKTHSLLAIRFVTRHMRRRRFDEVLYQLGSRGLVLDQDNLGSE